MELAALASLDTHVTRLGVVLTPSGEPVDAEGVLNPACARTRDGKLLLFPRMVASGNISRVGIVETDGTGSERGNHRIGFALEPREPYELRTEPGGYGCEDPRVTFIPLLDSYVMVYTAYGPQGPRIAFALSHDGYEWERMGLVDFSAPGLACGDDKDGAFFPEPVLSPRGVPSFAFYHRPMLHISAVDGAAAVPIILAMPARERESTRIAYVPVDAVLRDRKNLLKVAESAIVLEPDHAWGRVKNGGGTPPVRIDEGWLSLFHGVDGQYDSSGKFTGMRYSAGLVIHDAERPHLVRYRSPEPLVSPESPEELNGMVNNVVFPTGIDVRPGSAARTYDIYYGMADSRIGCFHLEVGASELSKTEAEESAALLLRFYVLATLIVVGALLVALRFGGTSHALQIAAVQSSGSPSAPRPQASTPYAPRDVTGNAPWALSALPECFEQTLSARGSLAFVRAHLPAGGEPVRGAAELRSADCRVRIEADRALVQRGSDELVIPPQTTFYRWPDRIGFVRRDAAGSELRVYRMRNGSPVVLTAAAAESGPPRPGR